MVFAGSKRGCWEPAEKRYKDDIVLPLNYLEDVTLAVAAAIVT